MNQSIWVVHLFKYIYIFKGRQEGKEGGRSLRGKLTGTLTGRNIRVAETLLEVRVSFAKSRKKWRRDSEEDNKKDEREEMLFHEKRSQSFPSQKCSC